jgi:hypothetical protein
MNKEEEITILIDRMYKLQEAYKGFTTRLRLIEAAVDKLEGKNNGSKPI